MSAPLNYPARTWLSAVLIVIVTMVIIWLMKGRPLLDGVSVFLGPDSYMRVARVEWWMAHGGWYDSLFPLSNAPLGEALHWTRPLDVILVAGTKILSLFTDPRTAMVVWASMISPICLALAVAFMGIGLRPVLPSGGFLLFAALMGIQPVTNSYAMVARPDHHALLLLLAVGVLASTIRIIMEPERYRLAALAGISGALGVWVAVESLLAIGAAIAIFGLYWLRSGDIRVVGALFRFCLVLAVGLVLAMAIERPPGDWILVEHDRLSISHVTLALLLIPASGLMMIGTPRAGASFVFRIGQAGAAGLIILVPVFLLFPDFASGPMAALDPRLKPVWFDVIKELQPYLPTNRVKLGEFMMVVGPALAGGALMVWWLRKGDPVQKRLAYCFLILLPVFAVLSVYQARWAMYLGFLSAAPWALLLSTVWREGPAIALRSGGSIRLRAPVFLVLLFWHVGLWAALSTGAKPDEAVWDPRFPGAGRCADEPLPVSTLQAEAAKAGQLVTVMADVDLGPELIYFSGQKVVAGPYHRNTQGILDIYDVFAATEWVKARAILKRRQVDLVMVCQPGSELASKQPDSPYLGAALEVGKAPDWLVPVDPQAPPKGGYQLYRFNGQTNP